MILRIKDLPLVAALILCPCILSAQTFEAERIARNETEIAAIKSSILRVESKIDKLDDHLDGINEQSSSDNPFTSERMLYLIALILGGDKAGYWLKRRNGTWAEGGNGHSQRSKA